MWDIVRGLVADGVTIFLTTQYLEEADRLASRICLLDSGRVVARGTPAELKRLVPGGSVRLHFGDTAQLDRAASAIGDRAVRDDDALSLQVPSDGTVHGLRQLIERLDSGAIEVEGLSVRSADLDDVFLSLTGSADPQRADVEVPAP
jgi:ABC-2 type transport system ATP-binding protein